ncbi:MAG: Rieske (2Fe-2S) protein [Flavobacteriaceae bacterium]
MKNDRREFLKSACAPVALTLMGIPLVEACTEDPIDDAFLDDEPIEIDLTASTFRPLENINGWVNYQAKKLLLIRVSADEILAFNNACPHQGNRNGWSLEGNRFVCSFHQREYAANCNSALRCYTTRIEGTTLVVKR